MIPLDFRNTTQKTTGYSSMSALNNWSSTAAGWEHPDASAASQFFLVVVVVEAEVKVKARLLPQTTRHQLLLHKQFL